MRRVLASRVHVVIATSRRLLGAGSVVLALLARANAGLAQAALPPVHPLGATLAICPIQFRYLDLRVLSTGEVIASDHGNGKLWLLDASLRPSSLILDTLEGTAAHRYLMPRMMAGGVRISVAAEGVLGAGPGDTTLFLDGLNQAFLVVGPTGAIARTIAVPELRLSGGFPRFIDPAGRLVYLGTTRPTLVTDTLRNEGWPGGPHEDSVAVDRVNPGRRRVDTLAWLRTPVNLGSPPLANPIPFGDDWTMLDDGTIAIVREHDFHVDWIAPDGRLTSTPKMPYPWRRLSDSVKHAAGDSLHAFLVAHPRTNVGYYPTPWRLVDYTLVPVPDIVPDSVLPDYAPPFGWETAIGQGSEYVWIRLLMEHLPEPAILAGRMADAEFRLTGPQVYAVIDRRGTIVDRVEIPGDVRIMGFGPENTIYLASREGADSWQLVRVRIR